MHVQDSRYELQEDRVLIHNHLTLDEELCRESRAQGTSFFILLCQHGAGNPKIFLNRNLIIHHDTESWDFKC